MSLLDLLQTVGGRLGILEAPSSADAGEPEKIVTRTVTLEELRSHIQAEDVRALAATPAELALPFEKIFEAAGVGVPAHGWTVARLKALLRTEPYRGQERTAAQLALLNALSAARVPPEDLVREAVAQDQALDAFESFVCRKTQDRLSAAERRIAELDARLQTLQNERARLAEHVQAGQEDLRSWRQRKRVYERELASAVGYLTERPVITTDDEVK